MADGTVINGALLEIHAATTTLTLGVYEPGTYSPVNDMNRVDFNTNRPSTSQAVFMRPNAYTTFGKPEQTYTISGFKSLGDTGQEILDTAAEDNTVVAIKILRDGTEGWEQPVRVGSLRESAAPEGLQEISYDLGAAGPRVLIPGTLLAAASPSGERGSAAAPARGGTGRSSESRSAETKAAA